MGIPGDRDGLLVARVRAGDDSALATVYDEHADLDPDGFIAAVQRAGARPRTGSRKE